MITVLSIFASTLWILGLSIILAAWSMAYYRAHTNQKRVIEILAETRNEILISIGAMLTFAGWGLVDARFWASLIWYFLAIAAIVRLIVLQRRGSKPV